MLPAPRVVAIDDEPEHLEGLAQGLNQYGTACLPIHYTGEMAAIPPCPHVRVIFLDLHLGPGGGSPEDHAQDFGTIGGLLEETIKPSGPYLIVLWTMYPEQADHLHAYLKAGLQNVPKPFAVQALKKNHHLNSQGAVKSPEALVEAIKQVVSSQPQIGALINWEERVLGAASGAVSSIMELAESAAGDGNPGEEAGRLLANLAVEAVGKKHADEDRFRAVNEGLLPILGDRIASMRSREADNALWQSALGKVDAKLFLDEAARFNRLLHIAPSTTDSDGTERGAVIALPGEFSGGGVCRDVRPRARGGSGKTVLAQAAPRGCWLVSVGPGPDASGLRLCADPTRTTSFSPWPLSAGIQSSKRHSPCRSLAQSMFRTRWASPFPACERTVPSIVAKREGRAGATTLSSARTASQRPDLPDSRLRSAPRHHLIPRKEEHWIWKLMIKTNLRHVTLLSNPKTIGQRAVLLYCIVLY